MRKVINQHLKEGINALSDYNIQYQMLFNKKSTIGIVLLPGDPNLGASMHDEIIDIIFKKSLL